VENQLGSKRLKFFAVSADIDPHQLGAGDTDIVCDVFLLSGSTAGTVACAAAPIRPIQTATARAATAEARVPGVRLLRWFRRPLLFSRRFMVVLVFRMESDGGIGSELGQAAVDDQFGADHVAGFA
jgi:hypothetical protein